MAENLEPIYFISNRKEYGWLSNFYYCTVKVNGYIGKSAESLYQAAKVDPNLKDASELKRKICAMTPVEAKNFGKTISLRPNWEEIKVSLMTRIVCAKFEQNNDLRKKLINTGERLLVEDAPWDKYWGSGAFKTVNGGGLNLLGEILMKIRKKL